MRNQAYWSNQGGKPEIVSSFSSKKLDQPSLNA